MTSTGADPRPRPYVSRRTFLRGAAVVAATTAAGGGAALWAQRSTGQVAPRSEAVVAAESARRRSGARVVRARLTPGPMTVDLGGPVVDTWAYGDTIPGPLLRARAGDVFRVTVDNKLPTDTSVHWHGLALRNDMDGVPGMTQSPIRPAASFVYEFTAPDPGTYFFHPHTGVQLDRGLYGAMVIDDPDDPGDYDLEWIVVLDDWVDGTGRSADEVLATLLRGGGSDDGGSMGGMDMPGMDMPGMEEDMPGMEEDGSMPGMNGPMTEGMQSPVLGAAGDVDYPYYLVNGRVAAAPVTLTGKAGQRARIRIVNAGSDTAFRVAVGGHEMTVTHSDGFPVVPAPTQSLIIGMGERFDVVVTLQDGAFPLVAAAEGKSGQGLAVIRTGPGRAPDEDVRPRELEGRLLLGTDLTPDPRVRLPRRRADRRHDLVLAGTMAPYRWTINGRPFPETSPLSVAQGERVRLRFLNQTTMFHPMHLHGHTFGLAKGGARKDTVIVRPMASLDVELDADNPGQWAAHCHNIYHAEAGMMTTLSYLTGV